MELLPASGDRLVGLGREVPVRMIITLGDAHQSWCRDEPRQKRSDAVGEQQVRRGSGRSPLVAGRFGDLQSLERRAAVRKRERPNSAELVRLMIDGDPLGAAISVTSDGKKNTASPV